MSKKQFMFYQCAFSIAFWTGVEHYIRTITGQVIHLQEKDIFIYFERNLDNHIVFCVQMVIMLGKFHIHKRKWTNSKPNVDVFLLELHQYADTIKDCKNKKAIRTNSILQRFNTDPN